jgi:hypothetical protein
MRIRIVLATLLAVCLCRSAALGGETGGARAAESKSQVFDLEGTVRIHPKFLYGYYITGFGDGQLCALFGEERLKDIKPGSLIHVTGRLGTRLHSGGNEKNPSPFPRTWYIYMDVESVKVVRDPEPNRLGPSGPPGTSPRLRQPGSNASKAHEETERELEDVGFPRDLTSFSRILAGKIRAGDSLGDVEELLGEGRRLTADERTLSGAALLRWQKDQPEYYADGVEDRDMFLRWPIADGCTLQLQFRDGRLVNHAPESYVQKASEERP